MKFLLSVFALIFSGNAMAASPWELATLGANAAFRADYQAEKGSAPSADPVGFSLSRAEEEFAVRALYLEGPNLRSFDYGCHEHGAKEFGCHLENRVEHGAYTRTTSKYTASDMAKAVRLGVELFVAKVAPEAAIRTLTIWEAAGDMNLKFAFDKGTGSELSFVMCHYHGRDIDCHRQRRVGPNEPVLK